MKSYVENGKVVIGLPERIDTNNSQDIKQKLENILKENEGVTPLFDAKKLEYISSAGLRVFMGICKKYKEKLKMVDVSADVCDILKTTGLDQLLEIEKRLREVSAEGCEVIGEGGNGIVYRLDSETILKVYYGDRNSPEKIRKNQQTTKDVFIHGIPTNIAFDMVKVGDSYGVVYEMIDAKTLVEEINAHPDKLEEYAHMIVDTLKQLHSTEFEPGDLPDAKEGSRKDVQATVDAGYYTKEEADKLYELIDKIPDRNTFIHQDFHPGNIMLQNGEVILIDVEDAGIGHPIFDLAAMYLVYVSAAKSGWSKKHQGLGGKEFLKIWDIIIRTYFNTNDKKEVDEINRIINGYSRIKYLRSIATSPRVPDILRSPIIKSTKKKLFKQIDTLHAIP